MALRVATSLTTSLTDALLRVLLPLHGAALHDPQAVLALL